jgi:hypothetical protein
MSGRSTVSGSGVSRKIEDIFSGDDPPENGYRLDAIWCSTMPSEKMSVRWSTGPPAICSGDM